VAAFADLHGLAVAAVPDWAPIIRHSVAIKETIVAQDPHEAGPRKLLNFGHTVGHALESYLLAQPGRAVRHGEAVAAGLVCESWLATQRGLLGANELAQVRAVVDASFEPLRFAESEIDEIAAYARHDKKNRGDVIKCTLLRGIGHGIYDQPVTVADIAASLRAYAGR
jgi:3-dehydroquinate synthase